MQHQSEGWLSPQQVTQNSTVIQAMTLHDGAFDRHVEHGLSIVPLLGSTFDFGFPIHDDAVHPNLAAMDTFLFARRARMTTKYLRINLGSSLPVTY